MTAKKQKRDEAVEQATQKKKAEVKTQKKKEETSSSEESDSSESEEEKVKYLDNYLSIFVLCLFMRLGCKN